MRLTLLCAACVSCRSVRQGHNRSSRHTRSTGSTAACTSACSWTPSHQHLSGSRKKFSNVLPYHVRLVLLLAVSISNPLCCANRRPVKRCYSSTEHTWVRLPRAGLGQPARACCLVSVACPQYCLQALECAPQSAASHFAHPILRCSLHIY